MIDISKPPCYFCNVEEHAMKDCPIYLGFRDQAEKDRKEWYDKHKCCPKCGSIHTAQTLAGAVQIVGEPFEDNVNDAYCKCGWRGTVKELMPEKK